MMGDLFGFRNKWKVNFEKCATIVWLLHQPVRLAGIPQKTLQVQDGSVFQGFFSEVLIIFSSWSKDGKVNILNKKKDTRHLFSSIIRKGSTAFVCDFENCWTELRNSHGLFVAFGFIKSTIFSLGSICKSLGDKIQNVEKSIESRLYEEFKSVYRSHITSIDRSTR